MHITIMIGDTVRQTYRDALQTFLKRNFDNLCADCKDRSERNPLRALDCKVPADRELYKQAHSITQYLREDCWKVSQAVNKYLMASQINFIHDPRLVRVLDYYNRIIYEFQVEAAGEQGLALGGGGRYDHLVAEL